MHRGGLFGVYVQNVWGELFNELLDIALRTDSTAGRAMAVRRGRGRVGHLDVRHLTLQQLTNSGRLRIAKVPGTDNVADVGTKVLPTDTLTFYLERMGFIKMCEIAEVVWKQGIGSLRSVSGLSALMGLWSN
eukprot:9368554-Lingulodinium_polyedra.AAC.1